MTTSFQAQPARPFLLATAAIAIAIAIAVAACSSAAESAPPASPAASGGPIDLEGTRWLLTDYVTPDGATYTVPAAVTPLAEFNDGTISGSAGCNTFSGPYAIEGDTITLGPLATTKMACEEPLATVENAYLLALGLADKVAILEDGRLQLWDSASKSTLAFLNGS